MRIVTAAVAVTAAITGTMGAVVAHDQVRLPTQTPVAAAWDEVPPVVHSYTDCTPPAVLRGEECVTTDKVSRLPRMTPAPAPVSAPVRVIVVKKTTTGGEREHEDDDERDDEHDD